MNKNILKSIGACIVGIALGIILSLGTDTLLEYAGILPKGNLWVPTLVIVMVVAYRILYNIIATYLVAKLAPGNPMVHAVIVGILGSLVSAAGALVTADMNLGPAWYAWSLAILSLPSSIFAGWLYVRRLNKINDSKKTI